MKSWILAVATIATIAQTAQAAACKQWGEAHQVGAIDTKYINEASGLEWSSANPTTLYHINDSGDGPYVYVTDRAGRGTRKVKLKGSTSRDSEDLTLGPCPDGNGQCLIYGDIGDAWGLSRTPKLTIVRESELSKSTANILNSVKLSLEVGESDMEAMSFHPNGDVYIATKEYDHQRTRIMRFPRASLLGKTATGKVVATLDLSKYGYTGEGYLVTSMDIAPDGHSFLLLTYGGALEVDFDLASAQATDLAPYVTQLHIPVLPQQEAITYIDGARSFLYDTEEGDGTPLMRVDCEGR